MNPEMPEVAVFGGSFNPPHVAHTLVVAYVLSVYRIQRVMVIPTFHHPLAKSVVPYQHRVKMCELAMADLKRVEVSRIEEELGGESLTLNTLEELYRRFPHTRFRLVIGSDILSEASRWYRFDRVKEIAPLIVLARGGHAHPNALGPIFPEIGSFQIRELLRQGLSTSRTNKGAILGIEREGCR